MQQLVAALLLWCFCVVPFVRALPPDTPIPPSQLRTLLGARGLDVDFLKYDYEVAAYTTTKMQCLRSYGFTHVRLRTDLDITNQSFAIVADRVIQDALNAGVVPILAKIGDAYKEDPSPAQLQAYLDWWQAAATRYANYSHRLLFDTMIEPGVKLSKDYDTLNKFFDSDTKFF